MPNRVSNNADGKTEKEWRAEEGGRERQRGGEIERAGGKEGRAKEEKARMVVKKEPAKRKIFMKFLYTVAVHIEY